MINNPTVVKVKDKVYKINTDFRVALKCEEIAQNESIKDTERALAIIYLLFGENGINDNENWDTLSKLAIKYLSCDINIDISQPSNKEADIDYKQDERYIKTSFLQEYNIDLSNCNLHWWDFYDLLNGLTENAILNRVRYIRNYDISQIKDNKERQKILEQKKQVALKKKSKEPTEEQKKNKDDFLKALNMR